MTNTEKLYRGLLGSLDMEILPENQAIIVPHREAPVIVDGKVLVLPEENIKQPLSFWQEHVAFHPISENIYRAESEVMKRLEVMVTAKLSSFIGYLLIRLTEVAADKNNHGEFTPEQHKLLDIVKTADQKTVKFISNVVSAAGGPNRAYRLLRSHLKVGGKHDNKKWKRVAINTFPIFEDNSTKNSIFGVKGRGADVAMLPQLFKYILPESDVTGSYNYGSDDDAAPFFHALINGYVKILEQLNKICTLFAPFTEAEYVSDTEWTSYLDNLSTLKAEILPLDGNKGVASRPQTTKENTSTMANTSRAKAATTTTAKKATPAQANGPVTVEVNKDGTVSWSDITAARSSGNNVPASGSLQPTFGGGSAGHQPMMPGGNFAGNQPMMNPGFNNNFNNQPMMGNQPFNNGFPNNNFNTNQPMMGSGNFNNNQPFNGGFPNNNFGNTAMMPNNNFVGNQPFNNGFPNNNFNTNQPMMNPNNFNNGGMMPGGNFNGFPNNNFNNQPNANAGFPNNNFGNTAMMPGNNFGNNMMGNQPFNNGFPNNNFNTNQPMMNSGFNNGFPNNNFAGNTSGNFNAAQNVSYP